MKNSQLNLTCSFLSLPTTVKIQWKFRQKGQIHWHDADCKQGYEYECNASMIREHRTRSFCFSELSLGLSGSYRCESNFQGEPTYGSETVVEVIGIGQKFDVIDHKLVENEPGFIEVEVSFKKELKFIIYLFSDLC